MREQRKRLVGRVTSDKMQKTVVVSVENLKRHPLYNKVIRQTTKYKAHNPNDVAKLGDLVQIVEAQPMSREKRWAVEKVLQQAEA
ncbi:MAG TPA: 30S ribosomal protein S17 [Anaerolineae bacterium]|jgi:small subunit ribosomal protein S17|nr:30S ribosomal protein S17 [Anaerolineae bacterium]